MITPAIWFLGEIGPLAREAVAALTTALESKRPWTAILAARALWKINADTNVALPVLEAALRATDGKTGDLSAQLAVKVLAEMGPAAKPAVPELLRVRKLNWRLWREVHDALPAIQGVTGDE
jgi:hypothetical protein